MRPQNETLIDGLERQLKEAVELIRLAVITLDELDQDEVLPMRAKPLLDDLKRWGRAIQ